MPRTNAEERIPARMPTAVYEKIAEAAQAIGATLNQFLVQSAMEKATSILEQERIIALSSTAASTIFDLTENPPEPNENLKKAMRQRKDLLRP
jgi:uncharacterized protein (DUF1778 family)